ncbi:TPA: hypothetical protein GJ770_03930 [Legionella pneumophila]|nr:hypothetical protein [Legionella pneumophila]
MNLKFLNSILFTLFFLIFFDINAQTIDIQCNYDYVRDDNFNKFVKTEVAKRDWIADSYRKYSWWEFWSKRLIYFSINIENEKVTGGLDDNIGYFSNNTTAYILPNKIGIEHRLESEKNLRETFWIDRINGKFQGSYFELDPKTTKENEKYKIQGDCKPIQRLF